MPYYPVRKLWQPSVAILMLLCAFTLSACGFQPAIVDEPTPVPTPVGAGVPDVDNGEHSKSTPQPGAEPTLMPGHYTDGNGVPFPVPSTEANIIRISEMDVWGANLTIREVHTLLDPGHFFLMRAIDENGRFLVGEIAPVETSSFEPKNLAILDLDTNTVSTIAPMPTFMHGLAIDGDWIVWIEGIFGQSDNKIKAYNRATASITEIDPGAGNPNILTGIRPYGPTIDANSVDARIIVWAQPQEGAADKSKIPTVVKSHNLDTGHTTDLGTGGLNPAIAWPYVVWLEPDATSEVDGDFMSKVVVKNLETSELTTRYGGWRLGDLAAYGDAIVIGEGGTARLENQANTRRQLIQPLSASQAEGLTMNDRLVAWSTHGTPIVWDRRQMRQVRLTGAPGFQYNYTACIVNGQMLAWQTLPYLSGPPEANANAPLDTLRIYVLDTRQIP